MTRRLVSQMVDDEAGNRLGGAATQVRIYDDAVLSVLSSIFVDPSSGLTQPNPLTPNAGWMTALRLAALSTDTVLAVQSLGTFQVGDLVPIYDGTNTVYRVIRSMNAVGPTITVDSAIGVGFSAANTMVGNPDMQGHVWGYLDDAADKYVQTKDVGSTRVMPPIALPIRVPTAALNFQDEGGAVASQGIVNFIGEGVSAINDAPNGRVNVTITSTGSWKDGTQALPGASFALDTDTGFWRAGSNNFLAVTGGNIAHEYVNAATAVNYISSTPAATTTGPIIDFKGSDTNVDGNLRAKGTGAVRVATQNTNFPSFTGGASFAAITAAGGSANVDWFLAGKGTGFVYLASAFTDYVSVVGGTGTATFAGTGGSATVNIVVNAKGAGGAVTLQAGGVNVLSALGVASAVNYVQVKNSATTVAVEIDALGTDTNISINVVPKGTGSLLYKGAALAPGNGVTITSSEAAIGADVNITDAGTYVDGPSVSLAAGTWYISGAVLVQNTAATTNRAKLWDGTTVEASAQMLTPGGIADNAVTMHLSGIVVLGGTTTWKISVTADGLGGIAAIKSAFPSGGVGANASYIRAVKIA